MPNWVKTKLTFDGSEKRVQELREFVSGKPASECADVFDFNRIIPMPEELQIEESSLGEQGMRFLLLRAANPFSRTDDDKEFLKTFTELSTEEKKKRIDLGRKYLLNIANHNYTSWYWWRTKDDTEFCANSEEDVKMFKEDPASNHCGWNTKWNVVDEDVYWEDDNHVDFSTAWSFPYPVIKELARKFPDVKISFVYADEDTSSNTGRGYFLGEDEEYTCPETGSDEAYEIYKEAWEEENLVKTKSGE